ncbi:MAG: DinB family protein [Acidobacteriota bacterium]
MPYDVIGHLIHGEKTDWIPRARIILEQGEHRSFVAFDRFAQFENSKGKSLTELLDEFARLRTENVDTLRVWNLTDEQLVDLEGLHQELGRVTLRQLLATWVVHDLNHVRQIVTVMARRYDTEVGVWKEYLSILKS